MISAVNAHEDFYRDLLVASHQDAMGDTYFLRSAGRADYTATLGERMQFSGSIVGIGLRGSCATTAGSTNVRAQVLVNNTVVFETDNELVSATGPFTSTKTQTAGVDTFAKGDIITVKVFIEDDLTITIRSVVVVELEFDRAQVHHTGVTGFERAQNFVEVEAGAI